MTKRWEPVPDGTQIDRQKVFLHTMVIGAGGLIQCRNSDGDHVVIQLPSDMRFCRETEVDDPAEYCAMCQGNDGMEIIQCFETLPDQSELQTIADREDRTVWLARCVDVARVEPSSWTKEQHA